MTTYLNPRSQNSAEIFNSPITSLSLTIYCNVQDRIDSYSTRFKKIATLVNSIAVTLISFAESLIRGLVAIASIPFMIFGCVHVIFTEIPVFLLWTSFGNILFTTHFLDKSFEQILLK
jgi:hypothetical protein